MTVPFDDSQVTPRLSTKVVCHESQIERRTLMISAAELGYAKMICSSWYSTFNHILQQPCTLGVAAMANCPEQDEARLASAVSTTTHEDVHTCSAKGIHTVALAPTAVVAWLDPVNLCNLEQNFSSPPQQPYG